MLRYNVLSYKNSTTHPEQIGRVNVHNTSNDVTFFTKFYIGVKWVERLTAEDVKVVFVGNNGRDDALYNKTEKCWEATTKDDKPLFVKICRKGVRDATYIFNVEEQD